VRLILLLIALTVTTPSVGQTRLTAGPPISRGPLPALGIPGPMLRRVIRDSRQIFAGTVIKIDRSVSSATSAIAATRMTFRVEEPIRGVRKGQIVEVREWGGLWQTGERYRVGERVLLFLHPPSKLGLTSPVGGAIGRFEIDRDRRVKLRGNGSSGVSKIELRSLAAALRRAAKE